MSVVALVSACLASATGFEAARIAGLLGRTQAAALAGDADRLVDGLVSAIDAELAAQLDLVFAHPRLRRLESTWRGLHEIVERLPRDRGRRVEILNCSLQDLEADFDDAPEILKSGLFKLVYSAEYGPFGGRPFAAVVCQESFEPEDLRLLRSCAQVAQLAALQFVGQAGDKLLEMAKADPPPDPSNPWDAPSRWAAFRRTEEARFASLVAGRWLARVPERRDPDAERAWPYHESDAALRWASGTLVVALSFAWSFAGYRTPIHAFGGVDGRFARFPTHAGRTTCGTARPDDAERLDACGFLPLVERGRGLVEIAGDTTCLDVSHGTGRYLDEPGRSLRGRLPATLFAQRLVQYLKVLHREHIGTWHTREETEAAMSEWLREYAGDDGTHPLRGFTLRVEEVPGDVSHWRLDLELRVDRWAQGRGCDIGIVGRIDLE